MECGKPCLDMPDAIAEPPEQRFARCLLVAEPRGEPIDRRLDLGDPPRERVDAVARPEGRRGGKECVSKWRSRWSPYHVNKKSKDVNRYKRQNETVTHCKYMT